MLKSAPMNLIKSISNALEKACHALQVQQNEAGGFPLNQLGSPDTTSYPLFSTVTVLLAAGHLLPHDVVFRAIQFVLAARRSDGMWEYDPQLSIPADADDTACALAVIARHCPEATSKADAELLRTYWRPDDGPFRTWCSNEEMWMRRERDDAIVNANVVLALAALGVPATPAEMMAVEHIIAMSHERTRYYCSPVTIAYAAHRAGIFTPFLPSQSLARPLHSDGSLPMAQWLCATRRVEQDALEYIIDQQSADGSWAAEPWCTGVNTHIWGSSAITTAVCAEALAMALQAWHSSMNIEC